jgi:hypothetical protein
VGDGEKCITVAEPAPRLSWLTRSAMVTVRASTPHGMLWARPTCGVALSAIISSLPRHEGCGTRDTFGVVLSATGHRAVGSLKQKCNRCRAVTVRFGATVVRAARDVEMMALAL